MNRQCGGATPDLRPELVQAQVDVRKQELAAGLDQQILLAAGDIDLAVDQAAQIAARIETVRPANVLTVEIARRHRRAAHPEFAVDRLHVDPRYRATAGD